MSGAGIVCIVVTHLFDYSQIGPKQRDPVSHFVADIGSQPLPVALLTLDKPGGQVAHLFALLADYAEEIVLFVLVLDATFYLGLQLVVNLGQFGSSKLDFIFQRFVGGLQRLL